MLGFVDALCGEGSFLRKGLVVVLPTVSRRQLLRGGLFGLGALVAVSSWPSLLGLASKALVPANLTFASFSRHVGTTFRVHVGPNRSVDLKLVQVTQLARPTAGVIPASSREGFTLQFAGPSADPFKQGTYTVDHSALGTSQIFLVPARPAGSNQSYEAVFNRLWS
jgi:hypothetical protein